jgi:hypothetical protein
MYTCPQYRINIDIEFPRFPCEILSLDLQDIMMSHHANIGSIKKFRLNEKGESIDRQPYELLNERDQMKHYNIVKEAFLNKYGCRVIGSFTVKEVPGNFHVSSHAYQHIYSMLKT